jgi:hypothetical protein
MMSVPVKRDTFGNECEWLDGSLVMIRGSGNMSRPAIDSWAELILGAVRPYPREQLLCMLLDLSSPHQGLTPYASYKTQTIYQEVTTGRKLYIAVLLRNNLVNQLVKIFINQLPAHDQLRSQVFTQPEVALNWLQQQRAAKDNSS